MKTHRLFYSLLVLVAFLAFTGQSCDNPVSDKTDDPSLPAQVTSFQMCVDAGYPVMESYPRQCRDAMGNVFVEKIEDSGAIKEDVPVKNDSPEVTQPVTAPVTNSTVPQEPQDSPAADLDSINFVDDSADTTPESDDAFDYSLYDSSGRYYTDPDYDPTSPFDVDAYNNNEYDTTYDDSYDSTEVYDSPAADLDSINWVEEDSYNTNDSYYDDSYYYDDSTYVDPNACSPEGAIDVTEFGTYYCVDGIWTYEDYVNPYQ